MNAFVIAAALCAQDWEQSFERMDEETRRRAESIARLSEEVSLLNLINGLYLTKEQSERIIALAKEAGDLRDSTIREHAALLREFEGALQELRNHLVSCGHIPPEVEKRVQEKEGRLNEVKRAYFEKLRGVEKRLRGVLTDAQMRVIDPFNPCIIPPQDLKDPVRVGQAESETREIEEHLDTLRNLPDTAWRAVAEALFEMFLSYEEAVLGKFDPVKRRAEMERLLKLMERIRAMSDAEFEVEKSECARNVIRPIREFQEKSHELSAFYLKASGGLCKAGKFLLNPRVVPLIEEKMRHVCATGRTDLDKIDPAEPCHTCGRKAEARKRPVEHPGHEPRFAHFAAWLSLSEEQAREAREAAARGQYDLLTTLAAEREDGRNVLKEFLLKLLAHKEAEAFEILKLTVPGTSMTYAERIGEIKAEVEAKWKKVMTAEQYERYASSGIDVFKIKVGSLRWKR